MGALCINVVVNGLDLVEDGAVEQGCCAHRRARRRREQGDARQGTVVQIARAFDLELHQRDEAIILNAVEDVLRCQAEAGQVALRQINAPARGVLAHVAVA